MSSEAMDAECGGPNLADSASSGVHGAPSHAEPSTSSAPVMLVPEPSATRVDVASQTPKDVSQSPSVSSSTMPPNDAQAYVPYALGDETKGKSGKGKTKLLRLGRTKDIEDLI